MVGIHKTQIAHFTANKLYVMTIKAWPGLPANARKAGMKAVNVALLGSKLLTARNIKALSLALLFFVYTILALSTAQVQYLEILHKITVQGVFDQNLFGSTFADVVAAVGFSLLYVALSFRSIIAKVFSFIIFADCIILFLLVDLGQGLALVGLITLPLILLLLISTFLLNRVVLAKRQQLAIGTMPAPESLITNLTLPPEAQPSRFERRHWYSGLSLDGRKVAIAFLMIVIVLEGGAILKWASLPAFPSSITNLDFYDKNDPTWKFASLESALYHSFALLSPILLVLLAFAFLYKHFDIPNRIKARFNPVPANVVEPVGSGTIDNSERAIKSGLFSSIPSWVLLVVALATSVSIAIYPHLLGLDPAGSGISTEEQFYVNAIGALRIAPDMPGGITGLAFNNEIEAAFRFNGGDRPFSLLLMLALGNLTGLPDLTIVRFLPVLLAPLLVGASYILARKATWIFDRGQEEERIQAKRSRELFAGLVAILVALSPQIVVGIYGGLLANWMALIPAIFAMLFLIMIWNHYAEWTTRDRGKRLFDYKFMYIMLDAYGLFTMLVLSMLFHAYTWGFLIVAIGLFLIISVIRTRSASRPPRKSIIKISCIVALVIGSTIILDYYKSDVFVIRAGIESETAIASSALSIGNFISSWETLNFTAHELLGGNLANPVLLALAVAWALFRGKYPPKVTDGLLLSMIFVLSVPLLFGNAVLQSRIIYVIPFFIPAALILFSNGVGTRRKDTIFVNTCIIAVVLVMGVYALRALANT